MQVKKVPRLLSFSLNVSWLLRLDLTMLVTGELACDE
jgi:hypothetical protein